MVEHLKLLLFSGYKHPWEITYVANTVCTYGTTLTENHIYMVHNSAPNNFLVPGVIYSLF